MQIAVASAKGGVGKSFLAQNLAWSLCEKGVNTTLVTADGVASPCELLGYEGSERLRFLRTSEWLASDVNTPMTLVDMEPGYAPSHSPVFAACTHVVLVATPTPASLVATLRTARHALCDNSHLHAGIIVVGGQTTVATALQTSIAKHLSAHAEILGCVPWDKAVQSAESRRQLLLARRPGCRASKAVLEASVRIQNWKPSAAKVEFLDSWRPPGVAERAAA